MICYLNCHIVDNKFIHRWSQGDNSKCYVCILFAASLVMLIYVKHNEQLEYAECLHDTSGLGQLVNDNTLRQLIATQCCL